MSRSVSPATGERYGVERVCRAWAYPRSSYYAAGGRSLKTPAVELARPTVVAGHEAQLPTMSARGPSNAVAVCPMASATAPATTAEPTPAKPSDGTPTERRRRGPKPPVSDQDLLQMIRDDLAASPFQGEGHRKVFARLKFVKKIPVAKKRVLRIMRENNLLSPHRRPKGEENLHDGTICTDRPDLMWGTDGVRVETVDDGWVWIFTAVDHYNAECVGWHVCKRGDRFAALEPISMGLSKYFGGPRVQAARGLHLRMDHGTQYISDHFRNQVRFWGITPSYAFVAEPQTNGVAERFNRTLKEQAIHGRVFRDVGELRQAVAAFMTTYNSQWRLEKLRYLTPAEARLRHTTASLAIAA